MKILLIILFISLEVFADTLPQEEMFGIFIQQCSTQVVELNHTSILPAEEFVDQVYALTCATQSGFVFCNEVFSSDSHTFLLHSSTNEKMTFSNETKEDYTILKEKRLGYVIRKKEKDNMLYTSTCKGLYYPKEQLSQIRAVVINDGLDVLIKELKSEKINENK